MLKAIIQGGTKANNNFYVLCLVKEDLSTEAEDLHIVTGPIIVLGCRQREARQLGI